MKKGAAAALVLVISCSSPHGASADSPLPESSISVMLGYSFGLANTPFSDAQEEPSTTETKGNEPLVGVSATIGRTKDRRADLTFTMANFGRLVQVIKDQTTSQGEADVRRSILADLTLRQKIAPKDLSKLDPVGLYATLDLGFIFDAQGKEQGEMVPDASSYLLGGLSFLAGAGEKSTMMVDLLVGRSEVMTGLDLFDGDWRSRNTRIRPRIRVFLSETDNLEDTSNGKGFFNNIVLGIWGDMGLDDDYGDTYALFISKAITTFGSRVSTGTDASR